MTARKSAAVLLEEKKTGGRARVAIDKNVLKALAAIGSTYEEICAGLVAAGCTLNLKTLKRRMQEPEFREIYDQGLAQMKIGIRRQMLQQSRLMNSAGVTANIHLAKHYLGQTEKAALELSGRVDSTVEVTGDSDRVNRKLDQLEQRLAGRAIDALAGAGTPPVASKPH